MKFRAPVILAILLAAGCKSPPPAPDVVVEREPIAKVDPSKPVQHPSPKRIILFLGDGMGAGAVTAASYTKGEPLEMLSMTYASWMRNHEYEYVTTDSAASATAFATGSKTHFQAVSVKPGTTAETESDPANHLRSVLEAAEEAGMKTGLVATSRINHATPAAFASHQHYRKEYDDIAVDMSRSGVDVLLGAGSKFFEGRADGKDLFAEMEADGYVIARDADSVREASATAGKLVGLMHEKDMPPAIAGGRAMTLAEMTTEAIEVLDRDNEKGWFLLVEGSQIDWCEHDLAAGCTIAEMLDFDAAVGVGLDYARQRDDTLVIATSDHETGGLSVLDPDYVDRFAEPFGGEEKLAEHAMPPSGDGAMVVERLPAHFPIGTSSWTMALTPIKGAQPTTFELSGLEDWRYSVSFGHLSVQSRKMLKKGEEREFMSAHTTTHVPLFAEGVAAAAIGEVRDNAELGERLLRMIDSGSVESLPEPPDRAAKNVVVMIGDGMGINAITAAYYAYGGLFMDRAPVTGIVSTHAVDAVVNDSAASATAIATGVRSRRGAIGMVESNGQLVSAATLLERAEGAGWKTGIVTTTQLSHATPAAFYAHATKRSDSEKIAGHFVDMPRRIEGSDGVDVVVAGGADDFGDHREALERAGYTYRTDWKPTLPDGRSISLLSPQGLPSARIRHRDGDPGTPSLAEMTQAALDSLSNQTDGGIFLVVEGGQIDWLMHSLVDDATLVDEIADFDQAVQRVVEWAEKRGDTLVVVTADHDHSLSVLDNHYAFTKKATCRAAQACGGSYEYPGIEIKPDQIERGEGLDDRDLQGDYAPPMLHLQYGWMVTEANERSRVPGPHSANFVPLYAWGPGSTRLRGYVDQPEIGQVIADVAELGPAE